MANKLANYIGWCLLLLYHPRLYLQILPVLWKMKKPPKCMMGKDLCLVGRAGLDVSAYEVTTYDDFSKRYANQEKRFFDFFIELFSICSV